MTKQNTREESFPLEKILSCTPETYSQVEGKPLRNYKMVGVHHSEDYSGHSLDNDSKLLVLNSFAKSVPKDAEVVVEYRCQLAYAGHVNFVGTQFGIALIPRNTKKDIDDIPLIELIEDI